MEPLVNLLHLPFLSCKQNSPEQNLTSFLKRTDIYIISQNLALGWWGGFFFKVQVSEANFQILCKLFSILTLSEFWLIFLVVMDSFANLSSLCFLPSFPCFLSIFSNNFDVIVKLKNNLCWTILLLLSLSPERAFSKLYGVYQGQVKLWINPRMEIPQPCWATCSFLSMFIVKKKNPLC